VPRAITPPASTPSSAPSHNQHLGKSIRQHTLLLWSLGWYRFVCKLQHPSDCAAHLDALPHSAGSYLHCLASQGVPAPSTSSPWSSHQKRQQLRRGAHPSAHIFKYFLHQDMLDMVQKGYWTLLPFSELEHFVHLKLSPAGVIPSERVDLGPSWTIPLRNKFFICPTFAPIFYAIWPNFTAALTTHSLR